MPSVIGVLFLLVQLVVFTMHCRAETEPEDRAIPKKVDVPLPEIKVVIPPPPEIEVMIPPPV